MFEDKLQRLRQAHQNTPNPSLAKRRQQLDNLEKALINHKQALIDAVNQDFNGRAAKETSLYEIIPSLEEIRYARNHLKTWLKPEHRGPSFWLRNAKTYIQARPKGVVGIMVPWNYPIFLAIGPLVAALAAGNKVMLKLSEDAPHTAEVLQNILGRYISEDELIIVTGEVEASIAFSKLPLDHLLFTGSSEVGHHILRDAAQTIKPVTLELGGKSPAILSQTAELSLAVQRIINGKLINAGQTCVAPDYVLLHQQQLQPFIEQAKKQLANSYPDILNNPNYTSIINSKQHARLQALLKDAEQKGAKLIPLSQTSGATTLPGLRQQPYIIVNPTREMLIMQQEIFGPLLPLVVIDGIEHAVEFINQADKPLALYYFGHNLKEQQYLLEHSLAGGVTINGVIAHVAEPSLPFGGIAKSGMGQYHGKEGFDTFSHRQSIFEQKNISVLDWISAPYSKFSDIAEWMVSNIDLYHWSSIATTAALVLLAIIAAYAVLQISIPNVMPFMS